MCNCGSSHARTGCGRAEYAGTIAASGTVQFDSSGAVVGPRIAIAAPQVDLGQVNVQFSQPTVKFGAPTLHLGCPEIRFNGVHMALGDPEIELGAPTIVMGKPRIELQSSGVFASGTQPTISMAAPRIILGDAKIEMGEPCVAGGTNTQRGRTGGVIPSDCRCSSGETGHASASRQYVSDEAGVSNATYGYSRADKRYFSRFIDASCGTVSESRAFGSSAASAGRQQAAGTMPASDPCCGKRIVSYRKLQALKTRHAHTFH